MTVTLPTLSDELLAPVFLFTDCPPTASRRVSVVVPVRNEADGIWQTLDALRNQLTLTDQRLSPALYEVLVLVNNCTDNSYDQVRRYQQLHPSFALCVANITLSTESAHIGTVRRLLMDEACRRLQESGHPQGVIASTDGDTLVDPYWISHILREIDAGTDAVGGRILTNPEPGPARLPHLRDTTYRHLLAKAESAIDPRPHDPWPCHYQHFGASLAVTCQAYLKAGRLPVVRYLEDDALVKALQRIDARVRKSPAVRVYTSARLQGRVEVGLSWQLQQWANQNEAGYAQQVEDPLVSITRFRLRHELRHIWNQRHQPGNMARLGPMARQLGVSTDWLLSQLTNSAYFGQCWELVNAQFDTVLYATEPTTVPITDAITGLRTWLGTQE
ncbi:glycosyltransferase [Fibrivirga algicola]|uniref:Glycosyltransferase family 2 protein n=1 Tax=Fibrivirga algicola TaxID=2950420 RepID=A0ABX0QKP2_9BACT|nr:glycosyltransferase family A protein [Fibrivirga algicola]NID13010.1 glycosyltransferase family 2 protein [Fibrivirga algicola]